MPTLGLTGAAGFVGGRVALLARSLGWSVVGVDDYSGPVSGPVEGVEIRRLSYNSEDGLRTLEGTDVVLHLAAISGVMACARDPPTTHRVNVDGLRRLSEACRTEGRPLAFASSLAVVGSPASLPVTEETPAAPPHEYARQKAEGERIVRELSESGVPSIVVRMSNVYGSYRSGSRTIAKDNVVNAFVRQSKTGTLRVNAPGTQRRDFIHVEDVARVWVRVAERLYRRDRWPLPNLLLARGRTYSVLEVAELVAEAHLRAHRTPAPLRVEIGPNPRGSVELLDENFEVDPRRTWDALGLVPDHDVLSDLSAMFSRNGAPADSVS